MFTLYCCIIVSPITSSFCTTTISSTKNPPCNSTIKNWYYTHKNSKFYTTLKNFFKIKKDTRQGKNRTILPHDIRGVYCLGYSCLF